VGQDRNPRKRIEGGTTVSEDAAQRDRFASDEDQGEDKDVEAHRKQPVSDEADDDADDVEAHRHATGA
jgi:hypothetical protein